MNILLLTNEYPPHIYGGAGVHVEHLVHELGRLDNGHNHLQVLCFGDQQENSAGRAVQGIGSAEPLAAMGFKHPKLLDTLYRNIVMAGSVETADIVHCHTWYTYLAGSLIKQLLQIPLVLTIHSLEPCRPWKKEQLGNGYYAAGWLEKTALHEADRVIAVSRAMRADILNLYGVAAQKVPVIYNGIDADTYRPVRNPGIIDACGIDAETPYVLFVGRVTRQKGIVHLLRAMRRVEARVQLVLCAGAADTPQIEEEVTAAVAAVRAGTDHKVIWLREMVPAERLIALYSHAAVFVCPSVYEPFGIINLEAMACGTPVVAAAVGGIPEVVVHDKTGLLVPFDPAGPDDSEPKHPRQFARDLAAAIDSLLRAPEKRAAMGAAARRRVEARFSWKSIARQTLETYAGLAAGSRDTTAN
ncbi:MAG: glycogen synthase [Desulfobacterales bacterium]